MSSPTQVRLSFFVCESFNKHNSYQKVKRPTSDNYSHLPEDLRKFFMADKR